MATVCDFAGWLFVNCEIDTFDNLWHKEKRVDTADIMNQ